MVLRQPAGLACRIHGSSLLAMGRDRTDHVRPGVLFPSRATLPDRYGRVGGYHVRGDGRGPRPLKLWHAPDRSGKKSHPRRGPSDPRPDRELRRIQLRRPDRGHRKMGPGYRAHSAGISAPDQNNFRRALRRKRRFPGIHDNRDRDSLRDPQRGPQSYDAQSAGNTAPARWQ